MADSYSHPAIKNDSSAIPEPTAWQRIGNQIDAAFIFALLAKKVSRGVLGERSSNNERLGSHVNDLTPEIFQSPQDFGKLRFAESVEDQLD